MIKKTLCMILIVSFAFALVSCSKGDAPEGTVAISNDAVDFTVYYPEGWVVETNEPKSAVISIVYGENATGTNKSSIRVTELSLRNRFSSAEEYWKSYLEEFEKQFSDLSIIDEKTVKLDDADAFRVHFTAEVAGETFCFIQVVALRNQNVYTITYTANQTDFDSSALDTVVKYFKFD